MTDIEAKAREIVSGCPVDDTHIEGLVNSILWLVRIYGDERHNAAVEQSARAEEKFRCRDVACFHGEALAQRIRSLKLPEPTDGIDYRGHRHPTGKLHTWKDEP